MKTDKEGKPVPRAEKYKRADGTEVHREYHRADDIPLPTKEEFEQNHLKVLLKLTPKRHLIQLEKHFTKKSEIKKHEKEFPPLPECFNEIDYFKSEFIFLDGIKERIDQKGNEYYWTGTKLELAFTALRLLDKQKLIEIIKTGQDCARIFCPFFHVKFNEKGDKQFQPERLNEVSKKFQAIIGKNII